MRRFIVWVDKDLPGVESDIEFVEMPDDASDEECNEVCSDCLETMISNVLDTGWNELSEEEYLQEKKRQAR